MRVTYYTGEVRLPQSAVLVARRRSDLRGYTDSEDWHLATLVTMIMDRSAWDGGVTPYEWRLSFDYLWYDGPLFQLWVGPFWVSLS